jgi:hypothetical protein
MRHEPVEGLCGLDKLSRRCRPDQVVRASSAEVLPLNHERICQISGRRTTPFVPLIPE